MARKIYNDEFKAAAAKRVREPGYTVKKAAHSLGRRSGLDPRLGPQVRTGPQVLTADASAEELRRDNLRLREENRRLLMEREILKKATAFFAREQP